MHEMSICEGIREVLCDTAQKHAVDRIARVRLEIGRFSGIEREALLFAFDVVMRGSPAEGAALEIIDVEGRALCFDCSQEVTVQDRLDPCPHCGSGKLMPTGGDEMRIKDLEAA